MSEYIDGVEYEPTPEQALVFSNIDNDNIELVKRREAEELAKALDAKALEFFKNGQSFPIDLKTQNDTVKAVLEEPLV